ncbi:bifunctional 3-deoxy-7-phosphoheptulonate synthase/chorismate mutase type II [Hymenobacter sp. ISL-91]|uniref:chorismate mutase n=1 Tax=Hymenobacter sp. ISL-91 TaxID=2819151 RepID=UPI001BE5FEC9|nr:chorismate mutase [Hymenobacter sp. ISL-91]MBT2556462.1 bifunctional 3-deoxy-7-phosphoheptulonate synthase/chorismate mutase type II [Hymenobacter sp. ISL-91]
MPHASTAAQAAVTTQFPGKKPLIISGPCSAETEQQLLETCTQLAATGRVDMLRAGIWKPRTKPGMFEGIGKTGLPWLRQARQLTGLPTTVEVATPQHVEDALAYDVDVLWIGARTTVNPFSVQALADALRGVKVPVFVKNPVHPDLELWLGAVERLAQAGIADIGLIHRGFASYGNTEYRNAPMWHLPIEIRRRLPSLPLICDPSHICGNRTGLAAVAQQSIDLDFDGLMLESHIDPDNAWSDAKQQVTPQRLAELLDSLTWRQHTSTEPEFLDKLARLRTQIDQLDDEILHLLGRRMQVSESIGHYKKENNITILQARRWNEILERALRKGDQLGLTADFIRQYFDAVHLESINRQNSVMNK